MAGGRARQLKVSALNIAFVDSTSHNKPTAYENLLRAIFGTHEFIPLRGERAMAIGSLQRDPRDTSVLRGALYGITMLDRMAWFSTTHHRPASDAEVSSIQVPEGMEANFREYDYEFHTKSHRLVFLTREGGLHLSALQARYVFQQLCMLPQITSKFGEVQVSIEQEPEQLERILDASDLRALMILVRRPNAGLAGFDVDFAKKLERVGAAQVQVQYKAAIGERLIPDGPMRTAAHVALSDGVVTATVRHEGITEELSTEDYPIVQTVTYKASIESRALALRRAAETILKRLKKA